MGNPGFSRVEDVKPVAVWWELANSRRYAPLPQGATQAGGRVAQ